MVELVLVGGVIAALTGAAALVTLAPWWWLFGSGWILIVAGMLLGVPAGFWYHVRLYRALKPTGWWWVQPFALHRTLPERERPRVLLWARLGAAGFVATVLGCVLVAVGAWRS